MSLLNRLFTIVYDSVKLGHLIVIVAGCIILHVLSTAVTINPYIFDWSAPISMLHDARLTLGLLVVKIFCLLLFVKPFLLKTLQVC